MSLTKSKKFAAALVLTASSMFMVSAPAFADHCAFEDSGPGESGYAKMHVQANNGPGDHNEGQHRGYSSCNPSGK